MPATTSGVMRVQAWLAAALAVAMFAGCSEDSAPPPPADDEEKFDTLDTKSTAETGVIRGLVLDPTITPIPDVTVKVTGTALATTTNQDGAFAFSDVEPGTYFLQAVKPGFAPVQASVTVVAGIDKPDIVKVQMIADPSSAPFIQPYVFDGFIECSLGGAAFGGYVYYSACSEGLLAPVFPEDAFATSYLVGYNYPTWTQAEQVWESTQTLSQSLSNNIHYPDSGETDGQKDLSVEGPSPLRNTMDEERSKEYLEGRNYDPENELRLRMRIFTRATDGLGPALTIQQEFTIYTHLFYNLLPPDDWWFITDGKPPY